MKRSRHIVGYNLHPVVKWEYAAHNLANAMAALEGVYEMTNDGKAHILRSEMDPLMRKISERRQWYGEHLRSLDPEIVVKARDGEIPWPDIEDLDGFQPRCTCHDRCLHEQGLDPGPMGRCICNRACPLHPEGE